MHTSPLNRQLEAYQEGWETAHLAAMRCREFEENLAVGVAIFGVLKELDKSRRYRVTIGLELLDGEADDSMKRQFASWLKPYEVALARLADFEGQFDRVEGADEFRACCAECQRLLAAWTPPQLSKALGMHATEFTVAEAKQLDELLSSGASQLRSQPRPIR
jgi:hypothetical protein